MLENPLHRLTSSLHTEWTPSIVNGTVQSHFTMTVQTLKQRDRTKIKPSVRVTAPEGLFECGLCSSIGGTFTFRCQRAPARLKKGILWKLPRSGGRAEMTPRRAVISYSITLWLCVCIDGEEATPTPAYSLSAPPCSFLFLSAALSLKCLFNQHGTCFKIKRGALVTPNGSVSASDALSGIPLSPPAKANALQISYISQTISPTRYAVRCLLEDHWLPPSDTCARFRWPT